MALSLGTRLGPYEILAPIGAGGMGEVYKPGIRGSSAKSGGQDYGFVAGRLGDVRHVLL